ncbi:glutathione synthase [Glaciecola petra]|uniref:Glutathione synthetase n=1 Tax=Glaciecola petra TaxID=3075602 RepID=A0ABU2ZLG1_9ALTE|nr:glutathione synthase [Aestuariibacter sp. P117]MDT0593461.1 glutathione synthase [Aestuariibacter sp. P117]
MRLKLGIVMDPIESINTKKDTSFAMLLEAQKRGYELYYMQIGDLYINNGLAKAQVKKITVNINEDPENYYSVLSAHDIDLHQLDVLLMRKDPPVDSQFIYATHIFSLAQAKGTLVVNDPQALRDFNEKLFTSWYRQFIPDTLVTSKKEQIKAFHEEHKDIIVKPLDGMGGTSIFRVKEDANNLGVISEIITANEQVHAMVQAYMPEISKGDKRILLVDGEVIPYCLARYPSGTETRGNLAAGGKGVAQEVSAENFEVANAIAQDMPEKGLIFVGLDMIGNKVTEINITSPTCVREIEAAFKINICAKLFDAIEKRLNKSNNHSGLH